jgi:hypothetical protein
VKLVFFSIRCSTIRGRPYTVDLCEIQKIQNHKAGSQLTLSYRIVVEMRAIHSPTYQSGYELIKEYNQRFWIGQQDIYLGCTRKTKGRTI